MLTTKPKYPYMLNPEVDWHSNAKSGNAIEFSHDEYMLEKLCGTTHETNQDTTEQEPDQDDDRAELSGEMGALTISECS